MEPEIARRCTDCGAAVRGGSLFCPQCGKALKRPGADVGGAQAEAAPEGTALKATDPGLTASAIVPQGNEAETAAGSAPQSPQPAQDAPPTRQPSIEGRRRAEIITQRPEEEADGRHRRRRMGSVAREAVEEKISPRVEKLRHASNVMLEEAAYDPSLRFVLVAAAAVILSLLLLLLNYLLG